jgi:hypothetical protein
VVINLQPVVTLAVAEAAVQMTVLLELPETKVAQFQ